MSVTPRPWTWFNYPDGRKMLVARDRAVIHCPDAPMTLDQDDAEFLERAVNLHDELLAFVREIAAWEDCPIDCDNCAVCDARKLVRKADGREP